MSDDAWMQDYVCTMADWQAGFLNHEETVKKLKALGFTRDEAENEIEEARQQHAL